MTTPTLAARPDTGPSSSRSQTRNSSSRWPRTRNAVRGWFARTHLGPVDNYISR